MKKRRLIVFYDEYCPLCIKSKELWGKIDILNLIVFRSLRNEILIEAEGISSSEMEKVMYSRVEGKSGYYKGFDSFVQMAKRVPLFWVMVPFMYFAKVVGIGDFIYKIVAKRRKIIPHNLCNKNVCQVSKQ